MKLIGLLITAFIFILLAVYWLNLTLSTTQPATTLPPPIENEQTDQNQTGTAPLDYSRKKIDEVNELNRERNEQIDNL